MRVPLARARDGVPQEGLVSLPGAEREKTLGLLQLLGREGVTGGNVPLEGVPEDGCSCRLQAGGDFPQQTKELPDKVLFVLTDPEISLRQLMLQFRFFFSYTSAMGTMPRREAREEQARINVKFASTVVIAAAIIVAVRLAREDISQPNPRVVSSVGQGIGLARMILNEVLRRFPGA
jgi:hypothetical protein